MMKKVPITFLIDFEHCGTDACRRWMIRDFAEHGAKHLVLTDTMIGMIMQKPNLADTVTGELADLGLDWVDSHGMFDLLWDLNCPVESHFRQLAARKKLELQIAADLGVKTMTVHVGNERPPYDAVPVNVHLDRIKRSLGEILPYAESCKVTVAIENIWFKINTPENLLEIKREFPTPYLGFCFDSGHANLAARSPELTIPNDDKVLEKMLPETVTCHLHDNDGTVDRHWAPGAGNIDWEHVRNLLLQAPRLQCIQCETIPVLKGFSAKSICEGMRKIFGSLG